VFDLKRERLLRVVDPEHPVALLASWPDVNVRAVVPAT
jgi:hypothetical protein